MHSEPRSANNGNINLTKQALLCGQLYELKKEQYWGNKVGQNRYLYNQELGSCLAANIFTDFNTNDFDFMVINMTNDATLLYYRENPIAANAHECDEVWVSLSYKDKGEKVRQSGCDDWNLRSKASEIVSELGFNMRFF